MNGAVAKSDFSIFMIGETGAGKELVVRELHIRSRVETTTEALSQRRRLASGGLPRTNFLCMSKGRLPVRLSKKFESTSGCAVSGSAQRL